jgi:hypothetical protein
MEKGKPELPIIDNIYNTIKWLSLKQYGFLSGMIVELGSMLGSWIKYYEKA